MFIGCLISFVIFGGLAFFTSKIGLNAGYEKESKFLALLFYFLAPLLTLSLLSCALVAAYSLLGVSLSAGIEAISTAFDFGSSGLLFVFGSIITAVLGFAAIAAGPATAFTASQVSGVLAAILIFASKDESLCKTWLPRAAVAIYGFCMWPFTAILTLGL